VSPDLVFPHNVTKHLLLATVLSVTVFASASLSARPDEPTPAQLARSSGSIPSVPMLRHEEITYARLKALLQSKSHIDRFTGATNLAGSSISRWKGTREQVDELASLALVDDYWAVRYEGAKFAYFRGKDGTGIIPALVVALDSEEPVVRAQVALAIEQVGGVDQALPRLEKMLATADQPLEVAGALSATDAGRKALKELASSTNTTARLFSNAGLIKAGSGAAKTATEAYLQDLRAALASKDAATVIQACTSVNLTGENAADAGRDIAALLSHADLGIRIAAANAIHASAPKDEAVVSAIMKAIEDKEIRTKCIGTLGRIGEKARPAIPALIKLMEHDRSLRYIMVVYAFPRIDPQSPEVLPALLKVLRTPVDEGYFDEHVIVALGSYGPAAKDAVPDLVKALGAKSGGNCSGGGPIPASIWALGQIGPDAAVARPEVEKHLNGHYRKLAATALARIAPKDPDAMPAPQRKYPGASLDF